MDFFVVKNFGYIKPIVNSCLAIAGQTWGELGYKQYYVCLNIVIDQNDSHGNDLKKKTNDLLKVQKTFSKLCVQEKA